MGESLATGGFTGTECATLEDAKEGSCDLPGRLRMGGINPKNGYVDIRDEPSTR